MNACHHSWLCPGDTLQLIETLDDWLGPTLAIISCQHCQQPALLNLVAWRGDQLKERIFGARTLTQAASDTYLANINRDYCDLTRKTAETEALIQTTSKTAHLVLVSLPRMQVSAVSTGTVDTPFRDWQDVDTNEFEHWPLPANGLQN